MRQDALTGVAMETIIRTIVTFQRFKDQIRVNYVLNYNLYLILCAAMNRNKSYCLKPSEQPA